MTPHEPACDWRANCTYCGMTDEEYDRRERIMAEEGFETMAGDEVCICEHCRFTAECEGGVGCPGCTMCCMCDRCQQAGIYAPAEAVAS